MKNIFKNWVQEDFDLSYDLLLMYEPDADQGRSLHWECTAWKSHHGLSCLLTCLSSFPHSPTSTWTSKSSYAALNRSPAALQRRQHKHKIIFYLKTLRLVNIKCEYSKEIYKVSG